jgi:Cys-tRNA(Pro) deacylase
MSSSKNLLIESTLIHWLRAREVPYAQVVHKKPAVSCDQVAHLRDIALENVLKCILLSDKKGRYCLACIPGNARVDIKRIEAVMRSGHLAFATPEEVVHVTGYPAGCINPLLLKQQIPVFFDASILDKELVDISAGNPNSGIQLHPRHLAALAGPQFHPITKAAPESHAVVPPLPVATPTLWGITPAK